MSETSLVIRCPYCGSHFDASPPESWLYEYSFAEPEPEKARSDAVKRDVVCPNPECGRKITLYWYAPMQYLSLM